jgi:hypothetical protein
VPRLLRGDVSVPPDSLRRLAGRRLPLHRQACRLRVWIDCNATPYHFRQILIVAPRITKEFLTSASRAVIDIIPHDKMSTQPLALQWSLQETTSSALSVARGVMRAATSDNIQALALLACERFGATLALRRRNKWPIYGVGRTATP